LFLAREKFEQTLMADHALWQKYTQPGVQAWMRASPLLGGHGRAPDEHGEPLKAILKRCSQEITPQKQGRAQETSLLSVLMRAPVSQKGVQELRKADFQAYRDSRLTQVAPATVVKEVALFHTVIEHAREEWGLMLAENPASIKHPRNADHARDRRLEAGEEEKLFAHASPIMKDVIVIAIDTALRRGEILALRSSMLKNMGTDRSYIDLPASVTKTQKARHIPLTQRAHDILTRLMRLASERTDDVIFNLTKAAVTLAFIKICRKAGITGLTLHDLRHEATSRFSETGKFNQSELMSITGHKSVGMFSRYLKTQGGELAHRLRKA
jgi:integrase